MVSGSPALTEDLPIGFAIVVPENSTIKITLPCPRCKGNSISILEIAILQVTPYP
jgi:hypothetical protein